MPSKELWHRAEHARGVVRSTRTHARSGADAARQSEPASRPLFASHPHGALGYSAGTRSAHSLPSDLVQLQNVIGNRAVSRLVAPSVQRQQPGVATDQDRREYIRGTARFFRGSADFYRDPVVQVDQALFERLINNWYAMVVDRERMIDEQLGGDAALKAELQAAYIAAIRVLMARAAVLFGRPEADLYRENNGRIPMWAWQTAHHTEAGISTPIAEGRSADPITGEVNFEVNGFRVTIAPDGRNDALGNRAETDFQIGWGQIRYETSRGRITRFDAPGVPTVRIQTIYGSGLNRNSPSGYGRGTTPEDQAGGRVTPASTTLGFHEGNHGLDFVAFIENNPPVQFTGTVGMTVREFRAAIQAWRTATAAFVRRMDEFSKGRTDCVGTTIDQFHDAQAGPRARVVHICVP